MRKAHALQMGLHKYEQRWRRQKEREREREAQGEERGVEENTSKLFNFAWGNDALGGH